MSKDINRFVLALGLGLLANGIANADEVTKSTSTEVNDPGYSASSTTTSTTKDAPPSVVKREATSTEVSPAGEKEVTVKKKYYVPRRQKTVTKHVETEINP